MYTNPGMEPVTMENHTMSATTTTTTAPSATMETLDTVATTVESLVGIMFAGKLTGINASVQGEIQVLGADANNLISEAKTALDNKETGNAAVMTLMQGVVATLEKLGIALPSEAQMFGALHQIVTDLEGAVMPAALAAPAA